MDLIFNFCEDHVLVLVKFVHHLFSYLNNVLALGLKHIIVDELVVVYVLLELIQLRLRMSIPLVGLFEQARRYFAHLFNSSLNVK